MFLRYNLFTVLWALLILVLILMPGQHMPDLQTSSLLSIDKLAHAFVFMVLVFLMIIGFIKQSRYPRLRNKAVQYALYISITYALTLEVTQSLSDGRTVDVYDGVANVVGCSLGFGFFFVVYKL